MKTILIACLLAIAINCQAQDWAKVKFDENLTVTIPQNYIEIDTLGKRNIRADIDHGLIIIQSIPNKGDYATSIRTRDELEKAYIDFQNRRAGSQEGSLIGQEFEMWNGLYVTRFSVDVTNDLGTQIQHYFVVFVNDRWYTIAFWGNPDFGDELQPLSEKLFQSIEFRDGLGISDQYSKKVDDNSTGYQLGYLVGRILGVLFIPLLVALVIYLVVRLVRKSKIQKEL